MATQKKRSAYELGDDDFKAEKSGVDCGRVFED